MRNWPYDQVNSKEKIYFCTENGIQASLLYSMIRLRSVVTIYLTAEEQRDDKAHFFARYINNLPLPNFRKRIRRKSTLTCLIRLTILIINFGQECTGQNK